MAKVIYDTSHRSQRQQSNAIGRAETVINDGCISYHCMSQNTLETREYIHTYTVCSVGKWLKGSGIGSELDGRIVGSQTIYEIYDPC